MADDEFENRENNLGELPEDISFERGDLADYKKRAYYVPPGSDVPPDIVKQSEINKQISGLPQGSPGYDVSVQSVFDTRPINATDFIASSNGFVDACSVADILLSYTIPEGRVAIIRGIRWMFALNAGAGIVIANVPPEQSPVSVLNQILLKINGVVPDSLINNNISAFQGIGMEWQTFHTVAGPGQVITAHVKNVEPQCNGGSVVCHVEIRGNLILTSGLPYPFEVGTRPPTKGIGSLTPGKGDIPTVESKRPYRTKLTHPEYISMTREIGNLQQADWVAARSYPGERAGPRPNRQSPMPVAAFEVGKTLWDKFMNDPVAETPPLTAINWDAWAKKRRELIAGLKVTVQSRSAAAASKRAEVTQRQQRSSAQRMIALQRQGRTKTAARREVYGAKPGQRLRWNPATNTFVY